FLDVGFEAIHPGDPPYTAENARQLIQQAVNQGPQTFEWPGVTNGGEQFWAEVHLTPIKLGGDDLLLGVVRKISERKEREQELEQRQHLIEALSTALPDYVFVYDSNGVYLDVLTGWESGMELYAPEDLVGQRIGEVFRSEVADQIQSTIDDVLESRDTRMVEYSILTSSDEQRWYESHAAPIPGGYEGQPAVLLAARNITDRKQRELELQRQKERIGSLHDVATDIDSCDTAQGVYDLIIETAEEILNFDLAVVDEATGDVLVPRAVSAELDEHEHYDQTPIDAEDNFGAKAYRTGNPSLIDDLTNHDVDPASTEFRSVLTVPVGEYGIFQTVDRSVGAFDEADLEMVELLITHAKNQLDRLEQQQRLRDRTDELERQNERLTEFASVVSHDLQNPLNVAQGRLELAQEEQDWDHVDDAASAVDRSLSLIGDLLALAREGQQVRELEPVNLAETAKSCWQNVATADATIEVNAECSILADRGRLKQLIENLISNAIEHGGDDVTITIGVLEDGFYFADDGRGIPTEQRDQIFELGHSSTKEGTGFGLNIVKEIADAHGWMIEVTESKRGGAKFEFTGVEKSPD
ncbi:MAG: ATP-binding protein, partial [Halobacteriaceae archaeon]